LTVASYSPRMTNHCWEARLT